MNKKTTSNQIRHCTTFLPTRTEATTCKKKTESTTNKILLQLMRQTIQFIQQKPFLQINRKKNLPLLKETRHRKSHKKKTVIVFHQIIEKKSANE